MVESKAAPSGNFPQPKIFWFVYYVLGTGIVSLAIVVWRDYVGENRKSLRKYFKKCRKNAKRSGNNKICDFKKAPLNETERTGPDAVGFGFFLVSILITLFYIIGLQVEMIRQHPTEKLFCSDYGSCLDVTLDIFNNKSQY